jgi:hypothetical protein
MSLKADKVKSGYAELDYSEREEVKKFIQEFDAATFEKRKTFSEGLNRTLNKSLGPVSSSYACPCCGKS